VGRKHHSRITIGFRVIFHDSIGVSWKEGGGLLIHNLPANVQILNKILSHMTNRIKEHRPGS